MFTNVIFDCDSTLSSIEGIDILAQSKGITEEIEHLTNLAMDGKVELSEVYGKRLELINPTRKNVDELAQEYINTTVKSAEFVIQTLLNSHINVYIISGGLLAPVRKFGEHLGIQTDNIFAVDLNYSSDNCDGFYTSYKETPLTLSHGKVDIINLIQSKNPGKTLLIGDGMSDALTKDHVDLFIGYGGIIERDKVKQISDVFFQCESLLPLLAFVQSDEIIDAMDKASMLEVCTELLNESILFSDNDYQKELISSLQNSKS